MIQILQATCTDGELILKEKLNAKLEGKKLQIIVQEINESEIITQDLSDQDRIETFLEHTKQFSFSLPPDYKFDRNEIYDC